MRELVAPSARERPRPRALGKVKIIFRASAMKCDQGLQHGEESEERELVGLFATSN